MDEKQKKIKKTRILQIGGIISWSVGLGVGISVSNKVDNFVLQVLIVVGLCTAITLIGTGAALWLFWPRDEQKE